MDAFHELRLDTRRIGRRLLVFDRTDSTNSRAAEFAPDPANDGLVIQAHEQVTGRGQHGRSWQCPPRTGVLLSVLLFPPPPLCRPAILTAWAGVSVCETIRIAANRQARIKWPNDVLIRGRKVCGILIESKAIAVGGALAMIAGIGLNVNQSADVFAAPGLEHGSSLALATGKPFDCASIARLLIAQLDEQYDRLCTGDLATLESCWEWRLGLLGKEVIVECGDATHRGRLRQVGWEALLLERADGEVMRLRPETVRHVEQTNR